MAKLNKCEIACPIVTFCISVLLFVVGFLLATRGYLIDPKDCIPSCRDYRQNHQFDHDDRAPCSEETQKSWEDAQTEAGCSKTGPAMAVTLFDEFQGDEECLPKACEYYYSKNFAEGQFQAIILIIVGSLTTCCFFCGCSCGIMKVFNLGFFKD
eukprot:TRINITY_DN92135_c0_g1_i1.p1 TRINITY_DN92135_c0_g1~~TRINITY_DN92135_c0_g1_i1.p1  ORF type:complete len:154 (-),score=19.99 TRINITY_DN92135_c0_g1_i1:15-476(-)